MSWKRRGGPAPPVKVRRGDSTGTIRWARRAIKRVVTRRGGYCTAGELLSDLPALHTEALEAALFDLLRGGQVVLDCDYSRGSTPIWWVFLPPLPAEFPYDKRRKPVVR